MTFRIFERQSSARHILVKRFARVLCPLTTLVVACVVAPIATSQAGKNHEKPLSSASEGRQVLASNCAACHGIDGKGSERAPNIADNPDVRRLSDAELMGIIAKGIPGTGMPAFHSLSSTRIRDLVAYLRSLEGATGNVKLPGDPRKGETIFFGQTGCSNCHMIAGRGGFIASDLTDYARTHSTDQIRSAILESSSADQVKLATVVLQDDRKYVGRVRNEDNFSLQLQSLDGAFHLIMKANLKKLDYDSQPLMPINFGSLLNAGELNDLVSYLLKTADNNEPQKHAKGSDMDNLEE
jgi:cytochrome c oxidase cbb3-type subunit III